MIDIKGFSEAILDWLESDDVWVENSKGEKIEDATINGKNFKKYAKKYEKDITPWINTKEQKPKNGELVILYIGEQDCQTNEIDFRESLLDFVPGQYVKEFDIFLSDYSERTVYPTHWMPMPKPPIKDE